MGRLVRLGRRAEPLGDAEERLSIFCQTIETLTVHLNVRRGQVCALRPLSRDGHNRCVNANVAETQNELIPPADLQPGGIKPDAYQGMPWAGHLKWAGLG